MMKILKREHTEMERKVLGEYGEEGSEWEGFFSWEADKELG